MQEHVENGAVLAEVSEVIKNLIIDPEETNYDSHHQQVLNAEASLVYHHREPGPKHHEYEHEGEQDEQGQR